MIILDGKKISNDIKEEIKLIVDKMNKKPKLVVIQIGDDFASNSYIKAKQKFALETGIIFEHKKLDSDLSEEDIINIITELNVNKSVAGIMVQLPLPNNLNTHKIINSINPIKDIDGLTNENLGKLFNYLDGYYPCTPLGIMELLKRYNIELKGKHAVILGRSSLVSKPLSQMLLKEDVTVTIVHSKTKNLSDVIKLGDIIISAIGKPKFIIKEMIKNDAIIIDVGINYFEDKLCGDVDFDNVKEIASYITPVPGGVGPMTVAMLFQNIIKSYSMKE